jgi:hypothetical protein
MVQTLTFTSINWLPKKQASKKLRYQSANTTASARGGPNITISGSSLLV